MTVRLVPDLDPIDPYDIVDQLADVVDLPTRNNELRFGPYTCQRCSTTDIVGLDEILIHAERCTG